MANRLDLHEMLCNILGTRNVYFQPPESIKMSYPAIRYRLSEIINTMADNRVYTQSHSYELIVIDKDPDGILKDKISAKDVTPAQKKILESMLKDDMDYLQKMQKEQSVK